MKKHLAILSVMVLLLLVASQLIWIRQVFERDKSRFKEELNVSINKIVQYQATRQTYKLFEMNPESPSLTLESIHPDSVPNDAKSYGSYETVKYNENKSLAKFLEAAMTEMLLVKDTLNIHIIDSLFQNNFPYTSELLAYSLKTKEKGKTIDSLYFGKNRNKQLNDTTKGVLITIPLGTSGTYRFVSHFVFKPSMATRNLMVLVWLSGIAVIAVALILFALLYHLQLQMNRLNSQEKRVRSIIHDLKSPLSYIHIMLDSFKMDDTNDLLKKGKLRIKKLSDSIERMLSEVKLNEKKGAALQPESYDLAQHCQEISEDLKVIHKEKRISIIINIAPDAQEMHVDTYYFDNCLRNLLENAVKYSGNTPEIKVTSIKEKSKIIILVADKGIGIPKKEHRRIFTSFYRSPSQSSIKGHGVGLSSVKQIVKAHGGNIQLKSEEGQGTVFTIFIPVKHKKKTAWIL